jgi:hypothetical protein
MNVNYIVNVSEKPPASIFWVEEWTRWRKMARNSSYFVCLPSWLCGFPTPFLLRLFIFYLLTKQTSKSLFFGPPVPIGSFIAPLPVRHSLRLGHFYSTVWLLYPEDWGSMFLETLATQCKATFTSTSTMHQLPSADQHHWTAVRRDRGVAVSVVVVGFVFVCVCVCFAVSLLVFAS